MIQIKKTISLALVLALFPLSTGAQAPEASGQATADPVSSRTFVDNVDIEVVGVEVFVADKKGQPITGLIKDDFELLVDGKAKVISNFYAAVDGRPVGDPISARPNSSRPSAVPTEPLNVSPEGAAQRLHMALVVDNTHIRATNRKRVFRDLRAFVENRLRASDLVTVISLNPELVIHSDFLSDRRGVSNLLDEIQRTGDGPRGAEMERRQILGRLSTTGREYDRRNFIQNGVGFDSPEIIASIRAWAESEYIRSQATLRTLGGVVGSLAGVRGRKALIYISDGIANRPGEEMYVAWSDRYGDGGLPAGQALKAAAIGTDYYREIGRFDLVRQVEELGRLASAAGVTWYSLDAESDHAGTLRSAALAGGVSSEALDVLTANVREPLELAAALTGGRLIQASTSLEADLAAMSTDFGTYYSLGFIPPPTDQGKDGAMDQHRIRVKVRGKGRVVRSRESWRPRSKDDLAAERTTSALLFHAVSNPLGVETSLGAPERRDDGNTVVPVEVRIPLSKVVLIPRGDAHATQLSLYVTTRDRRGQARRVQKIPFNAAIPADRLEQALGQSARYTLPLVVRPGDQQIALGVRDDFGSTESYIRLDLTSLN